MSTFNRTLDRRARFDERSRNFPIRAAIKATQPRSYTWRCPINLDQGPDGACTGFSTAHELASRPVEVPGVTNELATQLYHRAREIDVWPGEDYEGSSVLAAIKAAAELGYYSEYRWAFGVADLALGVSRQGPAVIGINWYTGMLSPDARGVVQVTGKVEGGHAILVTGFNVKTQMFRLHNSWGDGWGVKGVCYLSYADMGRLLSENGDACIPVRRGKGKKL